MTGNGPDQHRSVPVDARGAMGVQVGEGNTQIIYTYNRLTWTDGVIPPPLATVSGVIDSPYRGLSAFEERDAAFFFGREAAATQVLARMALQLDGAGLLVVSGVSGAGKSSLLRAGVLPRMRATGLLSTRRGVLAVPVVHPGSCAAGRAGRAGGRARGGGRG
jgi:hypothetical protein